MKTINTSDSYQKSKRLEKQEYLIFSLIFALFLCISAISRVLPRSIRPFASVANRGESIWQEARWAVHTVMGYAFMS